MHVSRILISIYIVETVSLLLRNSIIVLRNTFRTSQGYKMYSLSCLCLLRHDNKSTKHLSVTSRHIAFLFIHFIHASRVIRAGNKRLLSFLYCFSNGLVFQEKFKTKFGLIYGRLSIPPRLYYKQWTKNKYP